MASGQFNFTIPTTKSQRMILGMDFTMRVARTGHFNEEQIEELRVIVETMLEEASTG